jgi:hypothetical protein
MPEPLITIGITCYKEGDWLRECWESVLAQTDDRWEAVLVIQFMFSATYSENCVPFRVFFALTFVRVIEYGSLAKAIDLLPGN